MAKDLTPFWWTLFGAGGTISALLFPIHLFLNGLAFPLGWVDAPSYESLYGLVQHPITRLYVFGLVSLPLFHWAHRFRYALYDFLQLNHLNAVIAVLCYGAALAGTITAAYTLWNIP